jgi:hypothetical protein
MKNDKKNIKEPYEPADTPKPPQIINPNRGEKRENPVKEKNPDKTKPENQTAKKEEKPHLLGDETEIDDETTI